MPDEGDGRAPRSDGECGYEPLRPAVGGAEARGASARRAKRRSSSCGPSLRKEVLEPAAVATLVLRTVRSANQLNAEWFTRNQFTAVVPPNGTSVLFALPLFQATSSSPVGHCGRC